MKLITDTCVFAEQETSSIISIPQHYSASFNMNFFFILFFKVELSTKVGGISFYESPLKTMKMLFLFHLKNSFCS